jgi:hypothetical protein
MLAMPTLAAAMIIASFSLMSVPARADGREELVTCQGLINRAAQAAPTATSGSQQDSGELLRCQQIIRDWTLRESRMSVDEQGRPLR